MKINITKDYRELLDRCGRCGHSIKIYKLTCPGERKILVKCKSKACDNEMLLDRPTLVETMVTWNLTQRNMK